MSSSYPYIIQDPIGVILSFAAVLVPTMLFAEPVEVEIDESAASEEPATTEKDGDTADPKGKGKAVMVPIEHVAAS